MAKEKKFQPPQKRRQPGREHKMKPRSKAAGDSGIGRAAAVAFAKEGADVAINYLEEDKDPKETQRLAEEHGRKCVLLAGDIGDEKVCPNIVGETVKELRKLDILVNNAAEQHRQDSIGKTVRSNSSAHSARTASHSFSRLRPRRSI